MSQEEFEPNKPVHLAYLCGGLVLFYLLQWTGEWIWGYFTKSPSEFYLTVGAGVVAIVTMVILYRNAKIYGLVDEVMTELKKVVWPGAKDTRLATITVIVMTILSAVVLGLFDFVWQRLSQLIYG